MEPPDINSCSAPIIFWCPVCGEMLEDQFLKDHQHQPPEMVEDDGSWWLSTPPTTPCEFCKKAIDLFTPWNEPSWEQSLGLICGGLGMVCGLCGAVWGRCDRRWKIYRI